MKTYAECTYELLRRKPLTIAYRERTKRDAIGDCYRSARLALTDARHWAFALNACHYKRGNKKQYAFLTECLLAAIVRADWWRNHARWVRRNHPEVQS